MAAENSSPADLDRGHGAALRHRERSAVLMTIGFAVAAKHIGHFELRAIHVPELEVLWWSGLGLSGNRLREQIEWAGRGAHLGSGDAQIAGRGSQAAMTKQQLNGAHVGAGFQQMNCECVPKRMRCDRFKNPANSMRLLARVLHRRPGNVAADSIAWEEPLLGLVYRPPATQDL